MEQYLIQHSSHEAPPFLAGSRVYELLDIRAMLEALRDGLINFSAGPEGGVHMPVRTVLPIAKAGPGSDMAVMPAYNSKDDGLAVKLVTVFPGNVERGLPSHCATIFLLDSSTGQLRCLMDGAVITALRTAGASALAVEAFAPTPSGVLAIIGSGVEARSHLLVFRHVYKATEVRIFSRNKENARKFAAEVSEPVQVFDSVEEAVRGADVIVTVTGSATPILHGEWVKKGAVVTAVGAYQAHTRELDATLMESSAVIVDSREGAAKESGAILMSKAEIRAELGEVLAKKRSDFVAEGETVVFKSLGLAIEDAVTAKLVYERFLATEQP